MISSWLLLFLILVIMSWCLSNVGFIFFGRIGLYTTVGFGS